MYDNLIQMLTCCPDAEYGCSRCEYSSSLGCREHLMKQAANGIEELLKAAKSMHTWIFLNSGDEQAAYDECGLSDERNVELGYDGQYAIELSKEKT